MNITQKTIIILSVVIIGIILILWGSFMSSNVKGIAPNIIIEQDFKPALNFSFIGTDGKNYALEQFKGKIILLNFWATWCTPCIIEFPKLLKFAKQDQENIVLIALSVDEDPNIISKVFARAPKSFREKLQLKNVIIGIDSDKAISKDLFGTINYPETYVITPDMKIKTKIKGAKNWNSIKIKRMVYNH